MTLDTVRADHVGCYGAAAAETPVIDGLAARGLRFDQASTTVPLTTPAHASLFTGMYPPQHGVRNNGERPLASEAITLAERLRDAGYATAAFTSAFVLDRRYGLDQGFEHYDDRLPATEDPTRFGGFNERRGDATVDALLSWLDARDGGRPVFAWLHLYDAHDPYLPPPPFDGRFRGREYAGEVAFVDWQLGRVLEALERKGMLARTLVAVIADHGECLGEHDEASHGRTIYDAAMRVPFVLAMPGVADSGPAVIGEAVSAVDLAPTLIDALGLSAMADVDGISLVSQWPAADRAVYLETMMPLLNNGWAPLTGARQANAKYIHAPRPEYFDLAKDPFELVDRWPRAEPQAVALAQRLQQWQAGWPDPLELLRRGIGGDASTTAALSALGYSSGASPDGSIGVLDPKDLLPAWGFVEQAIRLQAQASAGGGPRKLAEAEAAIGKALEISPRDRAALEQLARIRVAQNRFDDAAAALKRYVEILPSADAYVMLAQLALRRSRPDEVEPLCAAARALEPAHGGARIALGDLFLSRGDPKRALIEFEAAAAEDPLRAGAMARARIESAKRALAGG